MKSNQPAVRLNKYLATQLGLSRRQADDFIAKGRVLVNGQPAELGNRVVPGRDTVAVNGKPVVPRQAYTYLMLYKPVGYVCSRRQQGETPTIFSLLPARYQQLKPVGRLDKDSSGLLLLTDDGDFAHRMTHPRFAKVKRYEVTLDQPLEPMHQQLINNHGLQLPDGLSKLQLQRLPGGDDRRWQVTMHEGRNRQIRRTFAALGYAITALHRTQFGDYALGVTKIGNMRELPRP